MTSILMVCLGNICRSPLAEGILRTKTQKYNLPIHIDSAGTSNFHIGDKPDKRSIANAQRHHIDISMLRARQFSAKDFDIFDYILVMDSNNYNDVVKQARNEKDKEKVNMILNYSYPQSNMAVPDPYYGGEDGFEEVFQLLDKACDDFINNIFKK
jgi:protein-tyrosine phosphatase